MPALLSLNKKNDLSRQRRLILPLGRDDPDGLICSEVKFHAASARNLVTTSEASLHN